MCENVPILSLPSIRLPPTRNNKVPLVTSEKCNAIQILKELINQGTQMSRLSVVQPCQCKQTRLRSGSGFLSILQNIIRLSSFFKTIFEMFKASALLTRKNSKTVKKAAFEDV